MHPAGPVAQLVLSSLGRALKYSSVLSLPRDLLTSGIYVARKAEFWHLIALTASSQSQSQTSAWSQALLEKKPAQRVRWGLAETGSRAEPTATSVHFLFQLSSLPLWGETEAEGLNAHTHEIGSQKIFLSSPCLKRGKFEQEMDNKYFPDLPPSHSWECQAQPVQLWQGTICSLCFCYYHTSQPSWVSAYVQPGAFRQSGDHFTSKTVLWTVVIRHCSVNSLDIQEAGIRKRAGRLSPGPSPTSPNQTCLSEGLSLLTFS